jgi:hypothetical protein
VAPDAHSRGYNYSPPRRNSYHPYSYPSPQVSRGNRHHLVDPYTLDYPAPFKQFAEWFRHTYPGQTADDDATDKANSENDSSDPKPKMMKVRHEKYKKALAATQVNNAFADHTSSYSSKSHSSRFYLIITKSHRGSSSDTIPLRLTSTCVIG